MEGSSLSSEARGHLSKALRKLRSAEKLLKEKEYDDSISRAYYAMLHAARAALTTRGSSPRTHEGVLREFGRLFIVTGELPEERGKDLSVVRYLRERCDYAPLYEANRKEAVDALRKATILVEAVARTLNMGTA
jgi:hypothetical protein